MAQKITKVELLKIPGVVEEIKRHLWIESERAGHDIGYERACEDWVQRFSDAWLAHYMPACKNGVKSTAQNQPAKKRRAKSYFFI